MKITFTHYDFIKLLNALEDKRFDSIKRRILVND